MTMEEVFEALKTVYKVRTSHRNHAYQAWNHHADHYPNSHIR
jgi:hypothetical protein